MNRDKSRKERATRDSSRHNPFILIGLRFSGYFFVFFADNVGRISRSIPVFASHTLLQIKQQHLGRRGGAEGEAGFLADGHAVAGL